jgi:hypothetical protein
MYMCINIYRNTYMYIRYMMYMKMDMKLYSTCTYILNDVHDVHMKM